MHKLNAGKYELPKSNFFMERSLAEQTNDFLWYFYASFTSGKHNKKECNFQTDRYAVDAFLVPH